MEREQKIIMSLYYADPNNDPAQITDVIFCVRMDMIQMLFAMEAIFDRIEYKYYINEAGIGVVPLSEARKKYEEMLDKSEKCLLQEMKVLAVTDAGSCSFTKLEYEEIGKYSPVVRNNLYFFNVLIGCINGTNRLTTRRNLNYYHLFSNRHGKEYVGCLISAILCLMGKYSKNQNEEADKVIDALNNDYELMKTIYNQKDIFLRNMQNREFVVRRRYKNNFFINQSTIFCDWIEKHQTMDSGILEFIFNNNYVMKEYALHFMQHIIRIRKVLGTNKRKKMVWEKEFDLECIKPLKAFYHLNELVKSLEAQINDPMFDLQKWTQQYIRAIDTFAKEHKFAESREEC